MIVCVCHSVSERALDRLVSTGCRTVAEVRRTCGAGGDCAACVPEIVERLKAHRARDTAEPESRVAQALAAK